MSYSPRLLLGRGVEGMLGTLSMAYFSFLGKAEFMISDRMIGDEI